MSKAPDEYSSLRSDLLRKMVQCDQIVNIYAFGKGTPHPTKDAILLENCPYGDLSSLQRQAWFITKAQFSEGFMWSVYQQLAKAVAFMHQGLGSDISPDLWEPIVHRDIKLENVFVKSFGIETGWADIKIKLGDFGLARLYDEDDPTSTQLKMRWGTSEYWPPEQRAHSRTATPEGDVWAVGTIIHELAHGFSAPEYYETYADRLSIEETGLFPPPEWKPNAQRWWYQAQCPRIVIPVNLPPTEQPPDPRRFRLTPIYSHGLNDCMHMALEKDKDRRATGREMVEAIYWDHRQFKARQ